MQNRVTIKVEKLVYGGDGMGRLPEGKVVFVPFVLPGEVVEIEYDHNAKGHPQARLVRVIESSPHRIKARCSFFTRCGGCHYQHLSYEHQVAAKKNILIDQFSRLAGMDISSKLTAIASEKEYSYRQNIQLHISSDGKLGYQQARSDQIIIVDECHLPYGDFQQLIGGMSFEENSGIQRVSFRWGDEDELQVMLESDEEESPELELDFAASVVFRSPRQCFVIAGDEQLPITVQGETFYVSASSFFQTNSTVAGRMAQHLLDITAATPDLTVMDMYCGVGFFSRFFARRGAKIIGIELNESAVNDFTVNLDAFDEVEVYQGKVEEVLPFLSYQADLAILDPPRGGLQIKAIEAIIHKRIPLLAYVSCDPATLARDIKKLQGSGYQLESITLFDQFPQTYHIESVALMSKVKG